MQSALAKKEKKEFLYYIAKVSHRWKKKSGTLFFSHCRILIGSKTTLPCHHTRDLGSRNLLIQSCNFMWGEYHRLKLYVNEILFCCIFSGRSIENHKRCLNNVTRNQVFPLSDAIIYMMYKGKPQKEEHFSPNLKKKMFGPIMILTKMGESNVRRDKTFFSFFILYLKFHLLCHL